jgi:hypothetical protein
MLCFNLVKPHSLQLVRIELISFIPLTALAIRLSVLMFKCLKI